MYVYSKRFTTKVYGLWIIRKNMKFFTAAQFHRNGRCAPIATNFEIRFVLTYVNLSKEIDFRVVY